LIQISTLLLAGFSIVSAVVLLFSYLFFMKDMAKTLIGAASCTALLFALSGLQFAHLQFLLHGDDLFASRTYLLLLLATPPAFFFFSREILLADRGHSVLDLLHLAPLALAFVVPAERIVTVAFAIGAGYAIWFARIVYGMRRHVSRFRFEMFFFSLFAVLAVVVLIFGLLVPYIDSSVFYYVYANFTGVAFVLIVASLIIFPEIVSDITEAAKLSYASSTLNDVDVDDCLRRLDSLMNDDRLYQNENLNLAMLAEALGIGSHQLSELINTRFGYGFSRYVRERRVEEAKRLLREDLTSSVLAISMMTGFRSQSNFYAAFREITGEAPGSFRKNAKAG
jgi:AraC-like DNA-binding protein